MTERPLVTIAIPVYNEEKYLSSTIESVIHQSYKNIRIIISDNCSTDSSFEVAKKYALVDNRIELFQHEENIGAIENFRFALSKGDTEYFMWMGAHDIVAERFIEGAVNRMKGDDEIALVFPKSVFFENDIKNHGESADSEIDTTGLTRIEAYGKVIAALYSCVAVHGVFKTEILKKVPLEKGGADHLILAGVSLYGKLVPTADVNFFRRIVRKETTKEAEQRLVKFKMYDEKYNRFILMSFMHIKYLILNKDLTGREKKKMVYQTIAVFNKRFVAFSPKQVVKFFLFEEYLPKVAFTILYWQTKKKLRLMN